MKDDWCDGVLGFLELRRSPQGVQTVGREAGEGLRCRRRYTHKVSSRMGVFL